MIKTVAEVRQALGLVVDPDVGLDIVELGLVEDVRLDGDRVEVALIMTTPACPQSAYLQDEATHRLRAAAGPGAEVAVEILPLPLWSPERLSASARDALGWSP